MLGKGNSRWAARTAEADTWIPREISVLRRVYLRGMGAVQRSKRDCRAVGECVFLCSLTSCVSDFHAQLSPKMSSRSRERGRDPLPVEDDCLTRQENARKAVQCFVGYDVAAGTMPRSPYIVCIECFTVAMRSYIFHQHVPIQPSLPNIVHASKDKSQAQPRSIFTVALKKACSSGRCATTAQAHRKHPLHARTAWQNK